MSIKEFMLDANDTAQRLRWAFFANGYNLTIVDRTDKRKKCKRGSVTASVTIDHAYLVIVIKLYRSAYEIWSKDRTEFMQVLVHEFCHFVIDPIYDLAFEHVPEALEPLLDERREAACERISRMLVQADQPGHVLEAISAPKEQGA